MINVYKKQQSRQTGIRNLMGPQTLPTIWGTNMKLVTKYQICVINSWRIPTGKPRIKYIAPRPTTKVKEEEEIDMSVYDRLYKVEVYTGEAGINANVSKNILFL
jgi:hypothetical protein